MTTSQNALVLMNWHTGETFRLKPAIANYFGRNHAHGDVHVAKNQVKLIPHGNRVEFVLLGSNPLYIRRLNDKRREFVKRNQKVHLVPGDGFTLLMDNYLHVIRYSHGDTPMFESLVDKTTEPQRTPNTDANGKRASDHDIMDSAPQAKKPKSDLPTTTVPSKSNNPIPTVILEDDEKLSNSMDYIPGESDEDYARRLQEIFKRADSEPQNLPTVAPSVPSQPPRTSAAPKVTIEPSHQPPTSQYPPSKNIAAHRSPYSTSIQPSKPSVNDQSLDISTVGDMESMYGPPPKKKEVEAPTDWIPKPSSKPSSKPSPSSKPTPMLPHSSTHNNAASRFSTAPPHRNHGGVKFAALPLANDVMIPTVISSRKRREEEEAKIKKAAAVPTKRPAPKIPTHIQQIDDDGPATTAVEDPIEDDFDDNILTRLDTSPSRKYTRKPH